MSNHDAVPHSIRRLGVPIILLWLGVAAVTNIAVPRLEAVAEAHQVGMSSLTRRRFRR